MDRARTGKVGALNWGLVGIFQSDLVAAVLRGPETVASRVVYAPVGIADVVLANSAFDARPPDAYQAEPVRLRWPPDVRPAPRLVLDEIVAPDNAHHHDPSRLAAALIRLAEHEGRRRPGVARTA